MIELLIALLPHGWPIIIATDEILERRQGKKIKAKGVYRDAVKIDKISRASFQVWRSSNNKNVSSENKPSVIAPYKVNND